VKLNLREKQSFYHELEQFLRSGIAMPQAVEALLHEASGRAVRHALERLEGLFRQGESVPSAFAHLRPTVGDMEVALISASSNSGRLEQALAYLSNYFGTLETARAGLVRQIVWPLIQLHVGVFLAELARQFTVEGKFDLDVYLTRCGTILGGLYVLCLVMWAVAKALVRLGQTSRGGDRFLRMLPVLGKLRRNFALSRFCATYEMQLQAGINVMDALQIAADASHSALIISDVKAIVPQLYQGAQPGQLLAKSTAFPGAFRRVLRLGEETGTLDKDLRHWSDYYQKAALTSLQTLERWVPKIFLGLVGGYLIYCIITGWMQMIGVINKIGAE
jgi:type IV pilus assembly protein PilC